MRQKFTKEDHVKQWVKEVCTERGAHWSMPVGGPRGRAGLPDFVVVHLGQYIAVETKFGRNKLSANQLREMRHTREAGGVALVINEANRRHLECVLDCIEGCAKDNIGVIDAEHWSNYREFEK